MIVNNPLIERYRCSMMRPAFLWVYAVMYFIIVSLLIFINYALYRHQHLYSSLEILLRSIYYQFLIFQTLLLWIFASYNTGTAIITEISERSYDFFKLLPLSAHKKAIGIMIGRNQIVILLATINCLLLVALGAKSGLISFSLQMQIALFLITSTILSSCLALMSSTQASPKAKPNKNSALLFAILAFYGAMVFVSIIQESSHETGVELSKVSFYGLKTPILVMLSAIASYLAVWTYIGSLRGITHTHEPTFTPAGAWLFLAGYILIILGFFNSYLPPKEMWVIPLFWSITFLPVACIPFAALRSRDKYMELTQSICASQESSSNIFRRLLLRSNLMTALLLFAIWLVVAIPLSFLYSAPRHDLSAFIIILSFYAVLITLSEVNILFSRKGGKLPYLIVLLVGLHAFLPLILAPILESENLLFYSVFGFISGMFTLDAPGANQFASILTVNACICAVPVMLISREYKKIISKRSSM